MLGSPAPAGLGDTTPETNLDLSVWNRVRALRPQRVLGTSLETSLGASFGIAFAARVLVAMLRSGCSERRSDRRFGPRSGIVYGLHWSRT